MSCIPVSSERVQGCLTGLTHGGVVYTTRVYNPSSVASDVACKAHAEAIAAEFSKPKMKAQGPRQQQHAVQVKLTFLSLKLTFLSLKLTFASYRAALRWATYIPLGCHCNSGVNSRYRRGIHR